MTELDPSSPEGSGERWPNNGLDDFELYPPGSLASGLGGIAAKSEAANEALRPLIHSLSLEQVRANRFAGGFNWRMDPSTQNYFCFLDQEYYIQFLTNLGLPVPPVLSDQGGITFPEE